MAQAKVLAASEPNRPCPEDGGGRSLVALGLTCAIGDAVASRDFADRLLQPVSDENDRTDARLLLTALCLHLTAEQDTSPCLADLARWLVAARDQVSTLAAFSHSPMQLVQFVHQEWLSLTIERRRLALDLCLLAADR